MKKLVSALCAVCLLLTLSGCSVSRLARRMDAAEERMEHRMDVLEDAVERSVRQEAAPAMAPDAPAGKSGEAHLPQPERSAAETITQEQAQKIALDHAGLSADQVQRLRTGYEIDDGIAQYDVEFLADDWEYEFEISAGDGTILSYDRDSRYD